MTNNTRAENLFAALPEHLINERRLIRHFFYGDVGKLQRTRSKIKQRYDNALFDMSDDALLVTLDSALSQAEISTVIEAMESSARSCNVEYDGLEVLLEEEIIENAPFDSFDKHFSPGSYVRFVLSNYKYGYMLYIGGNEKDGHFFDCISMIDDGKMAAAELDSAPRLYRQPVQGVFDPHKFQLVGRSGQHKLPVEIRFRISSGWPTPEEIDKIADEYSFQTPLKDCDWWLLVKKVVDSGKKIYDSDSAEECTAYVGIDGKVIWGKGVKISMNQPSKPMPFGAFARIDNRDAALTGKLDQLALGDKAF